MSEVMPLPEVQRRNWRAIKAALGVYFGAGFCLGLLLPETFVVGAPALAGFGRMLEPVIPGIARIADVSPFPNVMRLLLTVLWLGLPLAAYRVGRAWTFPSRMPQLRKVDRWFVAGFAWLFAIGSALFVFLFFDVSQAEVMERGGRGGWLVRFFTQERLGAALILPFWFCIVAGFTGIAARMTRLAAA